MATNCLTDIDPSVSILDTPIDQLLHFEERLRFEQLRLRLYPRILGPIDDRRLSLLRQIFLNDTVLQKQTEYYSDRSKTNLLADIANIIYDGIVLHWREIGDPWISLESFIYVKSKLKYMYQIVQAKNEPKPN